LRISLDQLPDDAFSSSPSAKMLNSRKRICEEQINLAESIQQNNMERNLVLMEVTQSALSLVDSSLSSNKKAKKKSIFPLKIGTDESDEVVGYLVLRYTISCSSGVSTGESFQSSSSLANDMTDDTEVSLTEMEAGSDDEEDEEGDVFKSPRANPIVKDHVEENKVENTSDTTVNDTLPVITSTDINQPPIENEDTKRDIVQDHSTPSEEQNPIVTQEKPQQSTDTTQAEPVVPELPRQEPQEIPEMSPNNTEDEKSTGEHDNSSNFFLLDDEDLEQEKSNEKQPEKSIEEAIPQTEPVEIVKDNDVVVIDSNISKDESIVPDENMKDHVEEIHDELPVKDHVDEQESMTETLEESPQQIILSEGSEQAEMKLTEQSYTNEENANQLESPSIVSPALTIESVDEKTAVDQKPITFLDLDDDVDIILSEEKDTQHAGTTSPKFEESTAVTPEDFSSPIESDHVHFESQDLDQSTVEPVTHESQNLIEDAEEEDDDAMFSSFYVQPLQEDKAVIQEVKEQPIVNKREKLHHYIVEKAINGGTNNSSIVDQDNKHLLSIIESQSQKILELENYSNSFHPLIIAVMWGLICSLIYSISQLQVSALNPLLVSIFYTIIVYFGVQLGKGLRYFNYGTHLVNYLKETKFLKKSSDFKVVNKEEYSTFEVLTRKYLSSDDVRFLDDLLRSASWGVILGVALVILKTMFTDSGEVSTPDAGFYHFFVNGILHKCLYRAVADELFERLFCFLLSIYLFKQYNLKLKIKYLIDRFTNPNHKEQYATLEDFERQNLPSNDTSTKQNTSGNGVMSLPDYGAILTSIILSTLFSVNDYNTPTFTSDSFIFDKILGSFAFCYMFYVQEKIELCIIAHFTKNMVDVLFGYY